MHPDCTRICTRWGVAEALFLRLCAPFAPFAPIPVLLGESGHRAVNPYRGCPEWVQQVHGVHLTPSRTAPAHLPRTGQNRGPLIPDQWLWAHLLIKISNLRACNALACNCLVTISGRPKGYDHAHFL